MRRIEIIGNLGKDSELKVVGASGLDVLNFSVAAKGAKKDDEAEWFRCALFGQRATKLSEFLKKGQKVFIRGEVRLRRWESNGKAGTDLDVTVDEVELLGSNQSGGAGGVPQI